MNLVWLDIETTDADHAKGGIIEIAASVTHNGVTETFECLVQPRPDETWDPFCVNMHDKSGLYDAVVVDKEGVSYDVADLELSQWLKRIFGERPVDKELVPRAAGFSVQFDLGFLKAKGFNLTLAALSHRIVDVSTLRDIAKAYAGWLYEKGEEPHRALFDCKAAQKCFEVFTAVFMTGTVTPWAYQQAVKALENHRNLEREACQLLSDTVMNGYCDLKQTMRISSFLKRINFK